MDSEKVLALFHKIGELKSLPRTGWSRVGVPEDDVESVAEHTFRTCFIAMVLGDILKFDTGKLLKLALLHDVAEVVTGDITPHDNITPEEKLDREEAAIREIFGAVQGAEEYISLWHEYSAQESKEAIVIRNIDKFEMALQASEYSRRYPDKDFEEFYEGAQLEHKVAELKEILKRLQGSGR